MHCIQSIHIKAASAVGLESRVCPAVGLGIWFGRGAREPVVCSAVGLGSRIGHARDVM